MGDSFRPLIQLYFDGELDTSRSLEVENHLLLCQECSAEYKRLQDLRGAFRAADLGFKAPAGLASKALKPVKRRRWALPTLSLAAACLALTVFSLFVIREERRQTDEVVTAHVRSLLASHLTDVASTSFHTVKPWLGNHLDFSPPVVDLADKGSPLIGGRLEYLGGRTAAALVYSHGKHVVNVFVVPGSVLAHRASEKGYNVEEWSAAGMHFWAVTDMNAQELAVLVADFRARAPR